MNKYMFKRALNARNKSQICIQYNIYNIIIKRIRQECKYPSKHILLIQDKRDNYPQKNCKI